MSNRVWIAIAAVVMQIALGAVYGWSVFVHPLMDLGHWTLTEVSLTFTIAIALLGVGTVIGGLWLDRVGPRLVASVAGMLYGAGFIISAWAVRNESLAGLYWGYGVLSGIGMGMGYICPVATVTKWFPERRGLMTGIAVMGYGAGALVMSPIAARRIIAVGVPQTFIEFGIAYLIVVVLTAQLLFNPPEGWRPAGWQPSTAVSRSATTRDYTVREAMATWRFWLLWLMLFLSVSAGIMIISQASPMAQQIVGLSAVAASGIVGVISIFNALGRVFWAWVSDFLGRANTYLVIYLIYVVMFLLLPGAHSQAAFTAIVAIIGMCYGGGFGVMPSFTADFFGARYMGGIYGWILLAWGAGAIPSPILIAQVRQRTGNYSLALHIIAVMMIVSLIFPILAKRAAIPPQSSPVRRAA
ncbi:MAG: OFA family MFS transporter [Acidobacteriia bacterium]|nr:OFA family MFS transporter [Terriglobia bacterium]